MTLADLVRRSQRLSDSTKEQYIASIEQFLVFAGGDPSQWTALAVEAWRDHLAAQGMRPQSVNTNFYAVRYASKRWSALGLGIDFAAAAEAMRAEPPAEKHHLSQAELDALLHVTAGATPQHLRDRAIIVVGIQAGGRRVAELASLTWQKVRWPMATFHLKGGRDHPVPLDDSCQRALGAWYAYCAEPKSGQVFRSLRRGVDDQWVTGKTMSAVAIYEVIRERGRQAGIRKIHPHLMRHTFVMRCLKAGVPVHEVMQMTGHKSLQSLSWYVEKARTAADGPGTYPRLVLPEAA